MQPAIMPCPPKVQAPGKPSDPAEAEVIRIE